MDGPLNQTTQSPVSSELLEWLDDGFIAVDLEWRILEVNQAAARLLECESDQMRGRALEAYIGEPHRRLLQRSPGEPIRPQRLVLVPRTGALTRPLEVTLHPRERGVALLLRDVSETIGQEHRIAELNATMRASQELLRRKNDELNQSLEELERLNAELEQMDRLKSEFLANTSHELRTPLNSIIGFLQLIMEGLCENRGEELSYVDNALTSAHQLLALINDILDIARIEAGKMTLVIGDHEIETLLGEVHQMMLVQARQKGLALSVELDPQTPRRVHADIQKVRQVLINLLGNAVKFTDQGSVRLRVGRDVANSDMIRFQVIDTGIGIPAHCLPRIFDKFMQVDSAPTRRFQGTGLGLTITRNLVEIMGGSIEAHSNGEDQGTSIEFVLPAGGGQFEQDDDTPHDRAQLERMLPISF